MTSSRIQWMDGLRGVAILSVILFHLYSAQYAYYLPYGARFSHIYLARFGLFGVELFFLISGFVILMTLERCATFKEFTIRRWLRLFPAMLIASLVIFSYDKLIDVGPYTDRSVADLIPGLMFLSPELIHTVLRIQLHSMDGPFWSLYVEVVFYAVFGTVYFARGWKAAVLAIFGLFLITYGLNELTRAHSLFGRVGDAMNWLGFIFFAWFAAGAIYYQALKQDSRPLFWIATAVAITAALTQRQFVGMTPATYGALLVVVVLFAAAQRSTVLQQLLASRPLVFVGFVSYPLYLIHSEISLGITHLIGERTSRSGLDGLIPVIPIALVTIVSWVIARFWEPAMRRAIPAIGRAWHRSSVRRFYRDTWREWERDWEGRQW